MRTFSKKKSVFSVNHPWFCCRKSVCSLFKPTQTCNWWKGWKKMKRIFEVNVAIRGWKRERERVNKNGKRKVVFVRIALCADVQCAVSWANYNSSYNKIFRNYKRKCSCTLPFRTLYVFQYPFGHAICRGTLHCTFSFTIKNFYDSTSIFFSFASRRNEAIGSEHSLWNYFNILFIFFFCLILRIFRIRFLCFAKSSQSKWHPIKVTALKIEYAIIFSFPMFLFNSFRLIKTSMQSLHVPCEHSKTEVNFHSKNSSNILKMCWKFYYFQLIWLAPATALIHSQLKNPLKYQLMIFYFPNGTEPFSTTFDDYQ